MFDINFRIVDDLEYLSNINTHQFDTDGVDVEGFFLLILMEILRDIIMKIS